MADATDKASDLAALRCPAFEADIQALRGVVHAAVVRSVADAIFTLGTLYGLRVGGGVRSSAQRTCANWCNR